MHICGGERVHLHAFALYVLRVRRDVGEVGGEGTYTLGDSQHIRVEGVMERRKAHRVCGRLSVIDLTTGCLQGGVVQNRACCVCICSHSQGRCPAELRHTSSF